MWPFRGATRPDADWFCAGLSSSFPDLVAQPLLCGGDAAPGCKVFHVPQDKPSEGAEVPVDDVGVDLRDQVLVFRFRGKFHAIEHRCPHSSYPLSQGILFDVEDFGVVLSAGIHCPRHNWSFDLFTGNADRGGYKLAVWEVQLREIGGAILGTSLSAEEAGGAPDMAGQEVWVRRKPRMG